jgi:ubiquinone/menaquinone biosynthesis C-methylase UbiE
LYDKSAAYYDAVYSFKNYEKESERLDGIIRQYKNSSGNTLLDVACGTGNHITYLKKRYTVEGLDLNRELLRKAKAKNPDVIFHKGDMCTFNLGKQFDIVSCLFSAIGHVKTRTKMRKAIANMTRHLKNGGILIVEPWFSPEQWNVGSMHANFVDQHDLKLARISISERLGNLSVNKMHYLVGSKKGIRYFIEPLELGLFTPQEYLGAFRIAGLNTLFDVEGLIGRGLYIGVKTAQ